MADFGKTSEENVERPIVPQFSQSEDEEMTVYRGRRMLTIEEVLQPAALESAPQENAAANDDSSDDRSKKRKRSDLQNAEYPSGETLKKVLRQPLQTIAEEETGGGSSSGKAQATSDEDDLEDTAFSGASAPVHAAEPPSSPGKKDLGFDLNEPPPREDDEDGGENGASAA